MYTPIFYIKDQYITDQGTNEWIQSNLKVAKHFFTLEEAIQYVNNSNDDIVKDLINKGYSVGYLVVPFNKRNANVEYSIITHAYKAGCVMANNLIFKYEIVDEEKS